MGGSIVRKKRWGGPNSLNTSSQAIACGTVVEKKGGGAGGLGTGKNGGPIPKRGRIPVKKKKRREKEKANKILIQGTREKVTYYRQKRGGGGGIKRL